MQSMLKVDSRRMFNSPLVYIMFGISLLIPVLILVMTTMLGDMTSVDPVTGVETTMEGFKNVWQIIGSNSNAEMTMDLTSMCNINLVFFMVMIFVCIFVAEDFRSGYAKNLFTIRAKRWDYVWSKTIICCLASIGMLICFFIGAMIGGAIAGLPFTMDGFNAFGIVCSMLAKVFLTLVFVAIALTMACIGKQKLWLSILCVMGAGMLLFMMIPMMTPLNASIMHVVMCLAGGLIFAFGLGAVSRLILNKFDIL